MPDFAHLLDPLPLLAVLGGAFGIATLQMGPTALPAALCALPRLFRADPEVDRDRARAIVQTAERIAMREGLPRIEQLKSPTHFIQLAISRLADGDVEHFAPWGSQAVQDRTARHSRVVAFWDAIADAAPAMGMAGTILGLIAMFARMNDPATIGPAMALALLTTLYGVILANMIAGPIARRLEYLSAAETEWQIALVTQLAAVGDREAMPVALPVDLRRFAGREPA